MKKYFEIGIVYLISLLCFAQTPLPLPKGYQRLDSFPIDSTAVYTNLAELQDYASNNASAYAGQILTLTENSTQSIAYVVNTDKTVVELGSGTSSSTISSNNNLTFGLCEQVDVVSLVEFSDSPKSITLDDEIIVFDGSDNVYTFDGSAYTSITNLSGLTTNLGDFSIATISTNLYLIGGLSDDGFGGTIYSNVYKFDGTTWSEVASLPAARASTASATLFSNIYTFGGSDQPFIYTNVYKFDGTTWSEVASLPISMSSLQTKSLNDLIYIFGSETNIYTFDGTNYTLIDSFPEHLTGITVGTISNYLFCFGGHSNYNAKTNVYLLDSETNWNYAASLLTNGYNLSASELNSNIYLFGGIGNNGIDSNIYSYSFGQSFGFDSDNIFKIIEEGQLKTPIYSASPGLDTNESYTFADGTTQTFDKMIAQSIKLGTNETITDWPESTGLDTNTSYTYAEGTTQSMPVASFSDKIILRGYEHTEIPAILSGASETTTIGLSIVGNGAEISLGEKGYSIIPFDCTLDSIYGIADKTNGSISIDLWKVSFDDYPQYDATNSICNSNYIEFLDDDSLKYANTNITNFATTSLNQNDLIIYNVTNCTNITTVNLRLKLKRTTADFGGAEYVSRTIYSTSSSDSIQELIDGVGKNILNNSVITIQLTNGIYSLTNTLVINGFDKGGKLYILGDTSTYTAVDKTTDQSTIIHMPAINGRNMIEIYGNQLGAIFIGHIRFSAAGDSTNYPSLIRIPSQENSFIWIYRCYFKGTSILSTGLTGFYGGYSMATVQGCAFDSMPYAINMFGLGTTLVRTCGAVGTVPTRAFNVAGGGKISLYDAYTGGGTTNVGTGGLFVNSTGAILP